MSLSKTIQRRSHYHDLKEKWIDRHKKLSETLWQKHGHVLRNISDKTKTLGIAGSLAGMTLLSSPSASLSIPTIPTIFPTATQGTTIDKSAFLIYDLSHELPDKVVPLTPVQEDVVSATLSRHFGMPIKAELGSIRLNRTYGYIGQEQHLARYPGETMDSHFSSSQEANQFASYGMAPGLGGFGYFAGKDGLTKEAIEREKYYIAVQTFLAPGWRDNVKEYVDFFAFRKMLVVNPQNGKAVVADIGDAGPADWTGKSLGGSPEVMQYLERVDGAGKGPVLYFFIDDPGDQVPLGPISVVQ